MAKVDRFYIGQIDGSGLQTDLKPYAIADNAFQDLNNAYVFRGRVRKRFGSRLMRGSVIPTPGFEQLQSRLRIQLANTDAMTGDATGTAPGIIWQPGQLFSIADQLFTVTESGVAMPMIISGSASLATFDTTNGAYVINGADVDTPVYFYPALPVMGLINYEQADINNELVFAFDTQFAYQFTTSGWSQLGTMQWSGDNTYYFWGYNWRGILSNETYLFVTNYVQADGIQYYDPNSMSLWNKLSPIINNDQVLLTGRIVLPFKDRLIVLNTVEGSQGAIFIPGGSQATNSSGSFNQTVAGTYVLGQQFLVGSQIFTIISDAAGLQVMGSYPYPGSKNPATAQFNFASGNLVITGNNNNINQIVYFFDGTISTTATYVNRCRYSLNGDPTRANGWLEGIPGLGGYVDAPTKEAIITAQFLKDRLIVYFEASTWELVYTNNQVLPFIWQQINTELGAESTFSQVPFDKVVLGVGNVGIHACNGSNVERIDDKIPNAVFDIHNEDNSVNRVYGIRDYYVEMVYWSFPDSLRSSTQPYNNKVLVYNYKNGSWSFNDDSITSFGYYQAAANEGNTWQSNPDTWAESNEVWVTGSAPLQARFKSVLAGNQEGFVFIVNPDDSRNAPALQITNMDINGNYVTITCIDHNLQPGFANGDLGVAEGDFIAIENVLGIPEFEMNPSPIYAVEAVIDKDTFTVYEPNATGSYLGGGTIARVSNIQITTKQYNFYVDQGMNASINKVDFMVNKTTDGEITVDYSVAASSESQLVQAQLSGSIIGTGVLDTKPYMLMPIEQTQERLWHPVYPMAEGECIQLNIYFTKRQLTNILISFSDFELHAMIFYCQMNGRLE